MASTKRMAGLWNQVDRGGETIWVHRDAPVWVVHYEAIEDSQSFRHAFYQPLGNRSERVHQVERGRPQDAARRRCDAPGGHFA